MIRKAKEDDVLKIMEIIKSTVKEMKGYNNTQWDENYPRDIDFFNDIKNGDLYVEEIENSIKGFVCINYVEPNEYKDLNWSSNEKCMVIHRMAVDSNFRNRGVGKKLISFAEELAKENNIKYIKTDTYSINTKMNSLFLKCGLKLIGEMSFLGKEKPFYCYDKILY